MVRVLHEALTILTSKLKPKQKNIDLHLTLSDIYYFLHLEFSECKLSSSLSCCISKYIKMLDQI